MFDPNRRLIFKSRDVTFINEGKFYDISVNNKKFVTIELDDVGCDQEKSVEKDVLSEDSFKSMDELLNLDQPDEEVEQIVTESLSHALQK